MVKYYVLLPVFTLLISVAPSEPGNLNTASLKRQHKVEVTYFPKPYKKRIEAVVAVCTRLHSDKKIDFQKNIFKLLLSVYEAKEDVLCKFAPSQNKPRDLFLVSTHTTLWQKENYTLPQAPH